MFNRIKYLEPNQEPTARQGRPAKVMITTTGNPPPELIEALAQAGYVPADDDPDAPICPDCGRRHY
jgi:hypothetical protein